MALGDFFPDLASLRAEIRRRLGLTAVTLPDASADALIAEALRYFLQRKPAILFGTFMTISGTQTYDPLPLGAFNVRRAWWASGSCGDGIDIFDRLIAELSPFLSSAPVQVGTLAVQGGAEPEAVFALLRQHRWLDRMLGATAKVLNKRTVYLVPSPTTSGDTVVFEYSSPRYATVFEIEEVEAYFACLVWRFLDSASNAAAGAGGIIQVSDPITGVSVRRASLGEARKAAANARDEFYLLLPNLPKIGHFP